MGQKLYKKNIEKIRNMYWKEGKTQKEIGEIFGVHRNTIIEFMKKNTIQSRNTEFKKGLIPPLKGKKGIHISLRTEFKKGEGKKKIPIKKIEKYYKNGYGLVSISEITGFSISIIRRRLLESGIKLRPPNYNTILSSVEIKFIEFFKNNKIPFKFCGDSDFKIGKKIPDFIEKNKKKICLEVSNKRFRNERDSKYKDWKEYEKKKTKYYKKHGWACLVLWEEELKNPDMIINKILNFSKI